VGEMIIIYYLKLCKYAAKQKSDFDDVISNGTLIVFIALDIVSQTEVTHESDYKHVL